MFFIWTAILEEQIAGKNNKINAMYKNGVFNSSSTSNILFEEFGYV